jgi:hypothetical protein
MSTRAAIGYKAEDGQVHAIYCHYDGYPSHVGKVLREFHNSPDACAILLTGSHIRSFDSDGTVARYGEGDGAREVYASEAEALSCGYDYLYLFSEDTGWECYAHDHAPYRGIVKHDIPK